MSSLKRGKTGVSSKAYPVFSRIRGFKGVSTMLESLRRFSKDEVAQQRLKIIEFYYKYGECATKEAFGCGRKTIWVWRKRLEEGRNLVGSLVPESTRPKTVRRMMTHPEVIDFIKKFQTICPYKITVVQTDNGLEFLGVFEEYLQEEKISHVFIYPRCCRVNGVVERYQRSLQEEFVDNHLDAIHNPTLFNQNLLEYLLFYNTERIHQSIGKKTPMDYLILHGELSKMSVTYTVFCKLVEYML